jgi:hypothetical protein
MAQTKRKRQTKHRGNAAGVVESRGRTGRKPTAAEKRGEAARVKEQRVDRRDRPPTWRAAFYRAMIASVLFLLASVVVLGSKGNAVFALFPIVLLGYTVISYYTDQWLFKRRQRAKARRGNSKGASR